MQSGPNDYQPTEGASDESRSDVPLGARLTALRLKFPLPAATGLAADKAFFDQLSGDAEDHRGEV